MDYRHPNSIRYSEGSRCEPKVEVFEKRRAPCAGITCKGKDLAKPSGARADVIFNRAGNSGLGVSALRNANAGIDRFES